MAEDAQTGGMTVGRYAIAEKTVPLPVGFWQILAQAEQAMPVPKSGVRMQSAALASLSGVVVDRMVVVHASADPIAGGWGIAGNCGRHDIHFSKLFAGSGSLIAVCAYVTQIVHAATPESAPVWQEADRTVRERGCSVPQTWLVAGLRIADEDDLLDVRYYFNPDVLALPPPSARPVPPANDWMSWTSGALYGPYALLAGPPAPADPRWLDNPWSPAAVATEPRRAAIVADLIQWAGPALDSLRAGFQNKPLGALADPPPWDRLGEASPGGVGGAAGDGGSEDTGNTPLWKTFSWRALGSGLDAAVSYAFTGSVGTASGITIVGGAVNAAFYYLHEIAWNRFGALGDGLAIRDMPPAGIDR